MAPSRATDRRPMRMVVSAALAATLLGAIPMTIAPVLARDPSPAIRPDRPAWDDPSTIATAAAGTPTQFIVRYRAGTAPVQRRLAVAHPGVRHVEDLPGTNLGVVRITADPISAIRSLQSDPRIASVEVDHQNFRFDDPEGETYWTELWGMHNTGQPIVQGNEPGGTADVDIDEPQALNVTNGSSDVVVAVIDDGVDFSHPELAGRAWTNPGESGGGKETNGVDDDGNGHIDDVHGWDFCHDDNTLHDGTEDFHGTHVAGTIAASLDGQGVVGVAPGVKIMALKFIGGSDCGLDSQAIEAINYAKDFDVRIANASWGEYAPPSQLTNLKNAIKTSGMLLVAAAGNNGRNNDTLAAPALPASFDLPNIISVAAIDNNGALPSFSNYGKTTVDIAAPGVSILSTVPSSTGYQYGWLSGTSMAAPHVSGVAALALSHAPALGNDIGALRARILGSGKADSKTSGKTATGRIVDAFRAVDTTAPIASAPTTAGFVKGSILGKTSLTGRVGWPAAVDDLTGVAAYGVGMQTDGGPWAVLTAATSHRTIDRTLTIGKAYAFRVRARDRAGNWGIYVPGPTVRPRLYAETTSLGSYSGSWSTSTSRSWSGGKTKYSRHAGASVTFQFTGRAFAIVAPKGASRGSFNLYIDGTYSATVSLYRSSTQARVLVATKTWTDSAAHTATLVVVGTKGHPRIDVDAFMVMR